jgi:iron uptake system component EfeO
MKYWKDALEHRRRRRLLWLALPFAVTACGKAGDDAQRARVELGMKQQLAEQIGALQAATEALERAAPTPAGRGWSATEDAPALSAMKDAWTRGRVAYELVEGALAPLFPQSDLATDARYDDALLKLGNEGDPDSFDARGVIGMHAIERILWADRIPAEVLAFEKALPGYRPAAVPNSEAEARAFKEQLAHQLSVDIGTLKTQFEPLELDVAFVFRGLIDLTREQLEKVDRAATGREESRYAQTTLRDLRANREGCLAAYRLFQPWLLAHDGQALDAKVLAGYERLRVAYDALPGDALPRPPAGWSSLDPRPEHLATPFGKLFAIVSRETDDADPSSLAGTLMAVADVLALPKAVLR